MDDNIFIWNGIDRIPDNVTNAVVAAGVTKIGDGAFKGCENLKSITLPDGIAEIGSCVFYGCKSLENIILPDGITVIGGGAFSGCASLKSITLPDGVTGIGSNAFYGCKNLESITIPDSVTGIGSNAFCGCKNLESITIPDSVTEIGNSTFEGCENLKSIIIPDDVTEIGYRAFEGCKNLKNIALPDGITEIVGYTFAGCENLESMIVPDGVTEIGDNAFEGCKNLKNITLPDGITEIGGDAFRGCKNLESITIPDGVTKIGERTFADCKNLRSIIIPDSVTEIRDYAFCGCKNLESITIPDGVTKIGDYAFRGCKNLEGITIPDGVTKIGDDAFADCENLKSVIILNDVTEIGCHTFYACENLESISLPDNVTEIDNEAFLGCGNLERVMYRGQNILPYLNYYTYGEDNFTIVKRLIDNNLPLNENIYSKAVDFAHAQRLDSFVTDYTTFGSMKVSEAMRAVPGTFKDELRDLFASQERTGKHIPRCLDKLALTCHAIGIPSEDLVKNFDIDYVKNIIKDSKPFVPAIACRCYYPKDICQKLNNAELSSIVAEALSSYNASHKECYKHAADFIVKHMDTNTELLSEVIENAESFNINENTTVSDIKQEIAHREAMGEVYKINKEYEEYGIDITKCECNIPPVRTVYNGRTSRVLDFNSEEDISLGARLGYLTNCCQHLDSAGETAMMHGFLNPDAGFFVIEDKNGNVKAQAEIWLTDKNTLVFDNIEFANTSGEDYDKRVKELRGDIANFAMQSGYENIIMGCGYNEFDYKKMEKADIPEITLTLEEVYTFQEDNDAGVWFDSVKEAENYMKSKKYDPDDFVYTDVNGKHGSVYIKHDGEVSGYLMKGYNEALVERQSEQMPATVQEARAMFGDGSGQTDMLMQNISSRN